MAGATQRTELMSQSAYAALRGVSKQAISKLVIAGKITLIDGKIDPSIADMQLSRELDPARAKTLRGMVGGQGGGAASTTATPQPPSALGADDAKRIVVDINTYAGARAIREKAEAQRAVLEYERLRGAVVDVEGVQRAAHEVARQLRDSLLGASIRIGPGLVNLSDPAEIVRRLEVEMRQILDSSAKAMTNALERVMQ